MKSEQSLRWIAVLVALLWLMLGVGNRAAGAWNASKQASPAPPTTQPPGGASALADPITTTYGPIAGTVTAGEPVLHVYKGVPFAAPPRGDLRWRPPQAPEPWEEPLACEEYQSACPQPSGRTLGLPGVDETDEDCLYLNVWTPAETPADALPVMVWIHGGGFTTGAGSMTGYDGTNLARRGVVVVTINYRLGPLGFMAHPALSAESERGVSGNYGFLDQVFALQWVRDNIAAFGGDPGCVTIFGESAGGVSVATHMTCPLSRGLFHRAISQSGPAVRGARRLRQAIPDKPSAEEVGEGFARTLGCAGAEDVAAALRTVSPQRLLEVCNPRVGLFGEGSDFGPIVDGWVLPDDPSRLWEEGRCADVPFMAGTNKNEGTLFLQQLSSVSGPLAYRLLTRSIAGELADEALEMYPVRTGSDVPAMLDAQVSDSFHRGTRAILRTHGQVEAPAYQYYFTRAPERHPAVRRLGCFHALEIAYVFDNLGRFGYEARDRELADTMADCWVQFARTGDPNREGLPLWPRFRQSSEQYLEFGTVTMIGSKLREEYLDLWDRIAARTPVPPLAGATPESQTDPSDSERGEEENPAGDSEDDD